MHTSCVAVVGTAEHVQCFLHRLAEEGVQLRFQVLLPILHLQCSLQSSGCVVGPACVRNVCRGIVNRIYRVQGHSKQRVIFFSHLL